VFYLLFFILEIKLPSDGFATRHFSVLVAEGDTHLDQSQVVTIGLDHLVFELSTRVWWNIHSTGILRVL